MKRNSFIKACLSAGALMSTPFVSMAKSIRNFRVSEGFKVDAGKDRINESISLLEGDAVARRSQYLSNT